MLEKTICSYCGSTDNRLELELSNPIEGLNGATWTLVKCKKCDLVRLDPRLSPSAVSEQYAKEFKGAFVGSDFSLLNFLRYQKMYWLRKIGTSNDRILDVGCGDGLFLKTCKDRGLKPSGCDIDETKLDYINKLYDVTTYAKDFSELDFPASYFDYVTMFHSLEHVYNPYEYVRHAYDVLQHEGTLVVEVPLYNGFDYRKTFPKSPAWGLPFHVYFFTKATLCTMLESSGFSIENISYPKLQTPFVLSSLLSKLGIYPDGQKGTALRLCTAPLFYPFELFLTVIGLPSVIRVTARKTAAQKNQDRNVNK